MKYKEYSAVIDYDEEQRMLHGRVIGIKDVINFYGATPEALEAEFKNSINDYIAFCKDQKKKPEKRIFWLMFSFQLLFPIISFNVASAFLVAHSRTFSKAQVSL